MGNSERMITLRKSAEQYEIEKDGRPWFNHQTLDGVRHGLRERGIAGPDIETIITHGEARVPFGKFFVAQK